MLHFHTDKAHMFLKKNVACIIRFCPVVYKCSAIHPFSEYLLYTAHMCLTSGTVHKILYYHHYWRGYIKLVFGFYLNIILKYLLYEKTYTLKMNSLKDNNCLKNVGIPCSILVPVDYGIQVNNMFY